jgi:general secretion pathway protein C
MIPGAPGADAGSTSDLAALAEAGITRAAPTEFSVRRPALLQMMRQQSELVEMAHALPVSRDGHTIGVQLSTLAPASVPARLGLQSGDVLTRVNDVNLDSSEHFLAAFTAMRSAGHVTVAIRRNDQPLIIEYQIR